MIRHLLFTLGAMSAVAVLASPARADDNAARTLDLAKRFTYTNVTSTEADRIFSDMKIGSTFNPKNTMKNLDPEWIPGWDALTLTDETKTAILQAAINRTWTTKIHADYQRYRTTWEAIDKQFRPALDKALSTVGFYARTVALEQLLDDVRKKAESDKVLYPPGSAPATVGFVADIVRAIATVHRDAHVEFLLARYLDKVKVNLADFVAAGRPFAADAVEREVFTAFAETRGTLETAALPKMAEYGKAYAVVKWPTTKHAAAEKAAIAKLVEANGAALAPTVTLARIPSLFGDLADPADPKLRWIDPPEGGTDSFSPLLITKVAAKDGVTTAVLVTKFDKSTPYGCKPTKTLDTTGSGQLYVQVCNYKHTITTHTLTVAFAELPAGLELKVGDRLALYADLEAKKDGKTAVSYTLTARALTSVKRDNTAVWQR